MGDLAFAGPGDPAEDLQSLSASPSLPGAVHWPEQPNPAAPYIRDLHNFAQGGIFGVLRGRGHEIPDSLQWMQDFLNKPDIQLAMGLGGPLGMARTVSPFWADPARLKILREMAAQKRSPAEIADAIPGTTEGAVSKQISRLGLGPGQDYNLSWDNERGIVMTPKNPPPEPLPSSPPASSPTRGGTAGWNPEDAKRLLEMAAKGASPFDMSEAFGVTTQSIRNKLTRLRKSQE